MIGFIILRHISKQEHDKYWIECYNSIRKYYLDNPIVIIDDNSNYDYITNKELYNCTIIKSEFPQRGEFLPYYYYLKFKFFEIAVIIHDTVFINKYIDFNINKYMFLWDFEHNWDQIEDETKMIKLFNDIELTKFYENKLLWKGCFGGMCIIEYDYLKYINNKYNLDLLIPHITTRYNRCSFERVIACLLLKNCKNDELSLLGNIHKYCMWGVNYNFYIYINKYKCENLPIIKIWSGR